MDIERIVNDPKLNDPIDALAARIRHPEHAVSDVIDAAGHQYIDLVMEGGGLLGVALIGYTWALERMGLRFLGIGGTSAGSINALLLAGLDEPSEAKSPQMLEELASKDFYDFVDGGRDVRDLLDLALDGRPVGMFKAARLFGRLFAVRERLTDRYGLNPGDHFLYYLKGLLRGAGIETLSQLQARMGRRPLGLALRGQEPFADDADDVPTGRRVVVAADVWSETRVELPEMAELYWPDAPNTNPAEFVRASMSIPFFFEPLRIEGLPTDATAAERWNRHAGLRPDQTADGRMPDRAMLVDGGLLSNFPINAFHRPERVPQRPTFGVKLEYDRRVDPERRFRGNGGFGGLLEYAGLLHNSSSKVLDYEFIRRNRDYVHLVQYVPCVRVHDDGRVERINWIDFDLPAADQELLFRQGAEQAIAFVDGFSSPVDGRGRPVDHPPTDGFPSKWEFYKALRRRLAETIYD